MYGTDVRPVKGNILIEERPVINSCLNNPFGGGPSEQNDVWLVTINRRALMKTIQTKSYNVLIGIK